MLVRVVAAGELGNAGWESNLSTAYIQNQREHHRTKSFKKEF